MEEKNTPGRHPKPLPGFEMAFYPPEWLYYDQEDLHADVIKRVGEET
jgi:hypothetical protein